MKGVLFHPGGIHNRLEAFKIERTNYENEISNTAKGEVTRLKGLVEPLRLINHEIGSGETRTEQNDRGP